MTYFFSAEEVYHAAIMIEQNGEKFYRQLKTTIKDEKIQKIFGQLADAEHQHMLIFERLLRDAVSKKNPAAVKRDFTDDDLHYLKALTDSNVFTSQLNINEITQKIHSTKDAIIISLQFEKDSIFFFYQMKKLVETSADAGEINKLIEQEQGHIKILTIILSDLK